MTHTRTADFTNYITRNSNYTTNSCCIIIAVKCQKRDISIEHKSKHNLSGICRKKKGEEIFFRHDFLKTRRRIFTNKYPHHHSPPPSVTPSLPPANVQVAPKSTWDDPIVGGWTTLSSDRDEGDAHAHAGLVWSDA